MAITVEASYSPLATRPAPAPYIKAFHQISSDKNPKFINDIRIHSTIETPIADICFKKLVLIFNQLITYDAKKTVKAATPDSVPNHVSNIEKTSGQLVGGDTSWAITVMVEIMNKKTIDTNSFRKTETFIIS